MKNSRSKKSILNISVSFFQQLLLLLLNFYSRLIFIKSLGIEYLGIHGFISNILSVLSFAELGVSTAIIYSMYTPIKEKNVKKITSLVQYYKKLYNIVGIVIFCFGLVFLPFLDKFIDINISNEKLFIYYICFLLNSVFSYLFIYASSIVIADQKEYVLKYYIIIFTIVRHLLQIFSLIIFKSYLLFLLIQSFSTLIMNFFILKKARKLYPYISLKNELNKKEKEEIFKNIKSMFFYKIGGVILNNTDYILISSIVGTVLVGYYSNYNMVLTGISGFTSIIFTSIQASVGNFNVSKNQEEKLFLFKVLNLISFFIYGIFSVGSIILMDDFINIWLGKNYILNDYIVYFSVITFYFKGILYPIWCFRNTTSIFRYTKFTMVYASIINIIFSILLGKKYGVEGILFATIIARLSTTMWYEPHILFKKYFGSSSSVYFKIQFNNIVILLIMLIVSNFFSQCIALENLYLNFILKGIISVISSIIIFILFKFKTEEFIYLKKKIRL